MPIANIDSANSPNVGSYTLSVGLDLPLYSSATGAIAATGAQATFGIPPQSSIPRGTLWFQAIPVGTVTGSALTVNLEGSFDGGTTFGIIQTGLVLVTSGVGAIVSANVSGLGGCGKLRLNGTTVTLGSSTGFNVFVHLG